LPAPTIASPHFSPPTPSTASSKNPCTVTLDTPDELALRSLLLGVVHRTIKSYSVARAFLIDAYSYQSKIENSTWIGGVTMFELAVLELKETEALEPVPRPGQNGTMIRQDIKDKWRRAIQNAIENLDRTMQLATNSTDLSSRLDTRVNMLRDEIMARKEFLGI